MCDVNKASSTRTAQLVCLIWWSDGDIGGQPLGQAVNQSSMGHQERGRELGVERDLKNGFNPILQVFEISSIIHVH